MRANVDKVLKYRYEKKAAWARARIKTHLNPTAQSQFTGSFFPEKQAGQYLVLTVAAAACLGIH